MKSFTGYPLLVRWWKFCKLISSLRSVETIGLQTQQVEAVTLEPVFISFVEALLGVISVAAMILLYLGHKCHPSGHLVIDPVKIGTFIASIVTDLYLGSIATLMSITADDGTLLVAFENLDCSSNRFLQESNTRILLQCILDLDLLDG
jgi:hypothetical protein